MSTPPLIVDDLSFRYRDRISAAIQQLSFSAQPGEIFNEEVTTGKEAEQSQTQGGFLAMKQRGQEIHRGSDSIAMKHGLAIGGAKFGFGLVGPD